MSKINSGGTISNKYEEPSFFQSLKIAIKQFINDCKGKKTDYRQILKKKVINETKHLYNVL